MKEATRTVSVADLANAVEYYVGAGRSFWVKTRDGGKIYLVRKGEPTRVLRALLEDYDYLRERLERKLEAGAEEGG